MAVDQIARMMALDAAQQGGGTTDAYTKAQTDALLDGKADLVDGKIPASELPSYVDDVVEYASTSAFPATGERGKIYIATDTNKTYRWGGTGYVEISESLALGETASTAYPGNKGKANADAISAIKDGTNIDSFADVETALANIPQVTVDQTYGASSTNAQSGVAIEGKKPGLKTTETGAEIFNSYSRNTASGQCSHAEGLSTTASGSMSHAEGFNTRASEYGSHTEGEGTAASGRCSHAEGYRATASGYYSHAEGSDATASGNYSHAEGNNTKAASSSQHVQGKYNVEDQSGAYAFIIGNGTSTNARHNAFAIDWNGLIYVNGAATGVDVSQLTPVTVDQTYNAQSANAQSGVAVAQALGTIPSAVTKIFSGQFEFEWKTTDSQAGKWFPSNIPFEVGKLYLLTITYSDDNALLVSAVVPAKTVGSTIGFGVFLPIVTSYNYHMTLGRACISAYLTGIQLTLDLPAAGANEGIGGTATLDLYEIG